MSLLTDEMFEIEFRNCRIAPAEFNHKAHVRLAWYCIMKYGKGAALEIVPGYIKNYVSHVGAADKYHETLTKAAVHTINHFINKSNASTFVEFENEFPRVFTRFSSLIEHHYSRELYSSSQARVSFMAPDLVPYDN